MVVRWNRNRGVPRRPQVRNDTANPFPSTMKQGRASRVSPGYLQVQRESQGESQPRSLHMVKGTLWTGSSGLQISVCLVITPVSVQIQMLILRFSGSEWDPRTTFYTRALHKLTQIQWLPHLNLSLLDESVLPVSKPNCVSSGEVQWKIWIP